MASTKFDQIRKAQAQTPDGWKFDAQCFLMWGAKEIYTDSEADEGGVFYRLSLKYDEEATGEGWSRKKTGRQLPTVHIDRYTPTDEKAVLYSVVWILRKTVGEPQNRRNFNNLLNLAKTLDICELFAEGITKDTGATSNYLGQPLAKTDSEEPETPETMTEETTTTATEAESTTAPEIDENSPITEGMIFIDADGKTFTITELSDMSVTFNNGERSFYDFGTSRTIKAVIDGLGNGAKLTKATPEEAPQDAQTAAETDESTTAEEVTADSEKDDTTAEKRLYEYGMRLRGFSIGCQPMDGFIERQDDATGKYWDIIVYNRPLTEEETKHYSLDDLTEEKPQEPAETPNNETAEPAPDMFSELAKAFITGKQAPQKPRKEATQEQKPEEPKSDYNPPEKETTAKAAPGYTGKTSDILTPEEAQAITNGEQVKKNTENYNIIYTGARYTDKTTLLYSIDIYKGMRDSDEALKPGRSFKYIGFICDNKVYIDENEIKKEMQEDINRAIIEAVPDEETARNNAKNCEDYQKEKIKSAEEYGKADAIKLFYKDERPTLQLYSQYGNNANIQSDDVIKYIESPAEVIKEWAQTFINDNPGHIAHEYIVYNLLVAGIEEITSNPAHIAHTIKAIAQSVTEDKKTAKIELDNGETVTAEAHAIRGIIYNSTGNISSYYIKAQDRNKLYKDERNRAEDIQPNQIKAIYHGAKTLYIKKAS